MPAAGVQVGQILVGPLFSEPMRVETAAPNGPGGWSLGLVGQDSAQFRRVALTAEQLASLTVQPPEQNVAKPPAPKVGPRSQAAPRPGRSAARCGSFSSACKRASMLIAATRS